MRNRIIDKAHRIRLHGPWRIQVPTSGGGKTRVESRQTIPNDWSEIVGRDFRGTVVYLRKFHLPTGLSDDQKVFLVIEQVDFAAICWLNEQLLGEACLAAGRASFDVTKLLAGDNQLRIEVQLSELDATCRQRAAAARLGQAGGLTGSVYLEIA